MNIPPLRPPARVSIPRRAIVALLGAQCSLALAAAIAAPAPQPEAPAVSALS